MCAVDPEIADLTFAFLRKDPVLLAQIGKINYERLWAQVRAQAIDAQTLVSEIKRIVAAKK